MILVVRPSKPFTYTAKLMVSTNNLQKMMSLITEFQKPQRENILMNYEEEINNLYTTVEETAQSNIAPPAEWDLVSTVEFVRKVVTQVLVSEHEIQDEDDLFQLSCDRSSSLESGCAGAHIFYYSLQATWIRNSLLRGVRDSAQLDTRDTAENFVYEHPSIARLTSFIRTIVSGISDNGDMSSPSVRVENMVAMAHRYTQNFPTHQGSKDRTTIQGDIVLITGTTGRLGSYALEKLVKNPKVAHVFAMNRVSLSTKVLQERQTAALVDRGIDPAILNSGKIDLLEGNYSAPRLGLSEDIFEKVSILPHITSVLFTLVSGRCNNL